MTSVRDEIGRERREDMAKTATAQQQRELDEANADLAWWEAIFQPIGYRIHGWTYRNYASVISPTGRYVEVDRKIIELVEAARSAPRQ